MSFFHPARIRLALALILLSLLAIGCSVTASNDVYFGRIVPPQGQVMRYVTGSESETLDPQVGTSQPDARIYAALYEGLVEYDPKNTLPIPAIAESWEINSDSSELVFHLRNNARWSNGEPITAKDFVYSFQRGLSPRLASRNAYLAYYIKYSQGYNTGGSFVRDAKTGEFVLEKDVLEEVIKAEDSASAKAPTTEDSKPDTPFHQYMHSPTRLVLPGDETEREALLAANPKIKDAIAGKELVPVGAQDLGAEAIDDHTLRITLRQPAPFFLGLLAHQFFRAVPRGAIEKYGEAWTRAENIVSSGPFKLKEWIPYDRLVVEKDPMYWDAGAVQLTKIIFYPVKDSTTIMNLYKAGEIDAFLNHTVPHGWMDVIRPLHDYMDAVENGNDYYDFNVRRGPFMDKRLRKAFNMAIDKEAFAKWRKTVKPLTGFVPQGIFPGYPNPKGDSFNAERARQLMAEAGFPVTKDGDGKFVCKNFPTDQVEINYNPDGMNTPIAEFLQAQWKQNLGVTLSLKSMEFRTFLNIRAKGDYKGIARDAWGGDYMDPFTFLNLFYAGAENGSGWQDPKYDAMLDVANRTSDPKKRFELFAKAESYMLEEQPVIPLDTPTVNWMKKPYVKGMYPNPLTLHAWKYVYIEYDQAKWDQGTPNMAE
ncbi:MAG: oligopeptide transport system substrate-binding protein [Acidobacteriota bacterium]|jgi:ABC-type oligopeptide transport system substrate-binding subunit|nr:oligopeptide transport system substrate-binding protein [Acidobacteriota bacterium]